MNHDGKASQRESETSAQGVDIRAGDRVYIPAGGLQLWINADGTTGMGVSLAVDPWLPDLSDTGATPSEVIEEMIRQGFPVSSISTKATVKACQKSRELRELVAIPGAARLKHLAVMDGTRACGVLDLDKARGQVKHGAAHQGLLVGDICEPLSEQNCLRGDSPLIDYVLTADERPFRIVQLTSGKLGTVDVEDLQKLPVRALLFIKFAQLETLLARRLCAHNPKFLEIAKIKEGQTSSSLGSSGSGPERRIERLRFRQLLEQANNHSLIEIPGDEIAFLERYRNNVAHGPRWYITRRADIDPLVNCVKRLTGLIDQLDAITG